MRLGNFGLHMGVARALMWGKYAKGDIETIGVALRGHLNSFAKVKG
jgi:hypothetical protein